MVTSREVVSDEIHSDKLQQRENSNTGFHESVSTKKGSPLSLSPKEDLAKLHQRQSPFTESLTSQSSQERSALPSMPEKVSNNQQLRQRLDSGIHASQSNQEGSSLSTIPEKEIDNFHQKQRPDSGIHTSQSNHEEASFSMVPHKEFDNLQHRHSPDTGIHDSESNQEGRTLLIVPEKVTRHGLDTDQEKITLSMRPEKVLDKLPLRRNPDIGVHVLQSGQEGKPPFIIPDKPSEDGYNWRKYGQKLVRGNEFIRSYYKCTFPNCPAKKQVERSHDGHITDIKYLRNHEHPKPEPSFQTAANFVLPIQARRPDESSLTISEEDESSDVHGEVSHHIEPTKTPRLMIVAASDDVAEFAASQSNNIRDEVNNSGDPDLKRRKIDATSIDDTLVNRTNGEPRVLVQTMSEVDTVNDGYRWRKYGQKFVKGNPNPRGYYRCTSVGCPVKKHVERASHDPKVVSATYEGQHNHNMPAARTLTHNAGAASTTTLLNGESRSSEREEKEAVGLDLVVHVSAN